jgi:alkaline phosphatase D
MNLKAKYKKLSDKPEFQAFKKSTKILATWDDHDYGWNDIGRHYNKKIESKDIFLDFFDEPASFQKDGKDQASTLHTCKM